jgi:pimeloyl-ACP methyl ester carboxylesterase
MLARGGYIDHIAWYRTGGAPQLLVLHGYTDSAACWEPLLRASGGRLPALALDARGHGSSGLPEQRFDSADMAADAATVLDRLRQGVTADGIVAVGHSMGAATAAQLARSRPDLVRALVLEDPVLHLPGEPSNRTSVVDRRAWLAALQAASVGDRIASARSENPGWSEEVLESWAVSKGQFDPHVLDLRRPDPEPLLDVLRDVRCPTLVVRGSPGRGSLVTDGGAAAVPRYAGGPARVVTIDGAGHCVRYDRQDRFVAELAAFIDQNRIGPACRSPNPPRPFAQAAGRRRAPGGQSANSA